jgi:hypothetical protein
LGEVDSERFISLITRELFDYTKWQKNLWADKSVEEISHGKPKAINKSGSTLLT